MVFAFLKKNWLTTLLYLAGFLYTFATLSSRFDGDFGWQLRFGREALSGHFPYLDTYTWSYTGRLWINHEWGGSMLWWAIYHYISYNALVLFVAVIVWTTFAFAPRVAGLRLTPASIIISLCCIVASNEILYTRLTVIAPAFFLILVYTLQQIPKKKYYYWWPILLWVWAALHGSWILGFIVIGIYVAAKLAEPLAATIIKKVLKITIVFERWRWSEYRGVLLYTTLAALTTVINPYGIDLWREVLTYFSQHYYVAYITEWQPAYVYPILLVPLIISALSSTLAVYAWIKNKLTLPQLLIMLALQYAAFSHKRNIIYAMLVSVPLLYGVLIAMYRALPKNIFLKKYREMILPAFTVFLAAYIVGPVVPQILWHTDVWHETAFLEREGFPASAANKMNELSTHVPLQLFNQFRWGGFFNWQNPSTLVYIDGRGTVSWMQSPSTTLYQHYRQILYEPGGLSSLESQGVNAILLEQPAGQVFRPNISNKLLFSSHDLTTVTTPTKSELELSLDNSKQWKKVYTDKLANMWLRTSTRL